MSTLIKIDRMREKEKAVNLTRSYDPPSIELNILNRTHKFIPTPKYVDDMGNVIAFLTFMTRMRRRYLQFGHKLIEDDAADIE